MFVKTIHTFMSHVSEHNLTRLMVQLLEKGKLTPAESTLADYVLEETNK